MITEVQIRYLQALNNEQLANIVYVDLISAAQPSVCLELVYSSGQGDIDLPINKSIGPTESP
jgi:hypothetical protein